MCRGEQSSRMKILMVHTYYRIRGGEDESFDAEARLLEQQGHDVVKVVFHNEDLASRPFWTQAAATLWNREAYARIRQVLQVHRPDVVHVQNTFPLASPAVIHAAKKANVPVVMTLRNYRLLCVNAGLFRGGRPCEDCLGKVPWRGVVRRCYRNSFPASMVVAGMVTLHRALRTWQMVDRFVVLSEFSRSKFLQAGFPKDRMVIKPNFVHPDPGLGDGKGGYALFVGRLSPEKGLDTLLEAWTRLHRRIPLRIVGDGPLARRVQEASERCPGIMWLGRRPLRETYVLMGEATLVVVPSIVYETFGRVAVEAFARGTPVVASRIGALKEIVEEERNGLLVEPGNPDDLVRKVVWLLERPDILTRMRGEARKTYEERYTAERNYRMLMDIYRSVLSSGAKTNAQAANETA